MIESPHLSEFVLVKFLQCLIDGHTQFQHKQLESSHFFPNRDFNMEPFVKHEKYHNERGAARRILPKGCIADPRVPLPLRLQQSLYCL